MLTDQTLRVCVLKDNETLTLLLRVGKRGLRLLEPDGFSPKVLRVFDNPRVEVMKNKAVPWDFSVDIKECGGLRLLMVTARVGR